MMNLIFLFSMYPVLFIMYFVQKNEGKPISGTLFGIRYQKDWLPDDEREELEQQYRRTLNRYLLILTFSPLITFAIPYFSINLTLWMVWLTAVVIMCMLPYSNGYKKLLALKKERCHSQHLNATTYTELKNAGIRCVNWKQFAPSIMVSILLTCFSVVFFDRYDFETYGILICIFAICTPLFYACAIWMDRLRSKVICEDSTRNLNYARASKGIYRNFWLLSAWLNNVFILALIVVMYFEAAHNMPCGKIILWCSILYTVGELYLLMRMIRQKNSLEQTYAKYQTIPTDGDEENWIGGILYYNPKDTRKLIDRHVGVGTTVNLATPTGKVFLIIAVLSLLIIPVMCIWCMLQEFTPISLTVNNDMVIARQIDIDYRIPTDSITELSLETDLPRCSKTNGSALDNLCKGKFRTSKDGRIEMFLNPQNEYYLRIVADDTIYYLGGYSDSETQEIYQQLRAN